MSQGPWYSDEEIEHEAQLFKEWMDKPESIFFKQFAVERGYPPQTLSDFALRSKAFRVVYDNAKHWQEAKVATQAFWGKGNSKIAQLILNVHHDWIEKQAVQVSQDDDMNKIAGKSKDIVNDKS